LSEFNSMFEALCPPRSAEKELAPPPPAATPGLAGAPGARARQAQLLLRQYAEELALAGNRLEREFLQAVVEGADAAFKRREKLRNRLQKLTQWGGREPYKSTLRLLDSVLEPAAPAKQPRAT
jgi:hypothetical protein